MKNPCNRCPNRKPCCSTTCEEWTIYTEERNKQYGKRRIYNEYDIYKYGRIKDYLMRKK